jgi:probable HAF family extracellular repeat protein
MLALPPSMIAVKLLGPPIPPTLLVIRYTPKPTHFCGSTVRLQDLLGVAPQFSGASDINNHGQVVGWSTTNPIEDTFFIDPFLWSGGVIKDLGTFGGIYPPGVANSINDWGVIVGIAPLRIGVSAGFIYFNGVMTDMGIGSDKEPRSINNFNRVVGNVNIGNTSYPAYQVFLWHNGNLRLIPTLGRTQNYVSSSRAINDWGEVVGTSNLAGDAVYHAFIYVAGKTYDLTPSDTGSSQAVAINRWNLVVGNDSGGIFLLQVGGKVRHLNDLLDSSGAGWVGLSAVGINDLGQIAGNGTHNGLRRPFLVSPY